MFDGCFLIVPCAITHRRSSEHKSIESYESMYQQDCGSQMDDMAAQISGSTKS